MLYIILLSHKFQWKRDLPKSSQFKNYLKEKIKTLNIDLIAEEYSKEALAWVNEKTTIAQDIALEFNIVHKFCDPGKEARKRIGYISRAKIKQNLGFKEPIEFDTPEDNEIMKEQRKFYHKRERYWLEQLTPYIDKNILFLCGFDHIDKSDTFESLIKEFEFNYEILPERFNLNLLKKT